MDRHAQDSHGIKSPLAIFIKCGVRQHRAVQRAEEVFIMFRKEKKLKSACTAEEMLLEFRVINYLGDYGWNTERTYNRHQTNNSTVNHVCCIVP